MNFAQPQPLQAAAAPVSRHRRPVLGPALYDLPELAEANEALLSAVLERLEPLGVSRAACTRSAAPVWSRLLLGQVGGYRYMKRLSDLVRPIATPRYRVEGADGPFNRSAVLVRAGDPAGGLADLRGRALALSDRDPDSGNLLRAEAALLARGGAFFDSVVHRPSFEGPIAAVAAGEADAALVDGVALAQLRRLRPSLLKGLRVLLWTPRAPGPPLISALALEPLLATGVAGALVEAARDPGLKWARDELLIAGFDRLEPAQYRAVLHFEQIAETLGYSELR